MHVTLTCVGVHMMCVCMCREGLCWMEQVVQAFTSCCHSLPASRRCRYVLLSLTCRCVYIHTCHGVLLSASWCVVVSVMVVCPINCIIIHELLSLHVVEVCT